MHWPTVINELLQKHVGSLQSLTGTMAGFGLDSQRANARSQAKVVLNDIRHLVKKMLQGEMPPIVERGLDKQCGWEYDFRAALERLQVACERVVSCTEKALDLQIDPDIVWDRREVADRTQRQRWSEAEAVKNRVWQLANKIDRQPRKLPAPAEPPPASARLKHTADGTVVSALVQD